MGGKIPDNSPEWLPLARGCYQAAALIFTALQTLGDYPADSPDYDPVAVDHLRKALQRLAPGLGNMEILGAPHPVKPRPPSQPPGYLSGETATQRRTGPGYLRSDSYCQRPMEELPIASQRPARDDETQQAPVSTTRSR